MDEDETGYFFPISDCDQSREELQKTYCVVDYVDGDYSDAFACAPLVFERQAKKLSMSSIIEFDRPIFGKDIEDTPYYISPGGYEVEMLDGQRIQFDFCDLEGYSTGTNTTARFEQYNLDVDAFPDANKLVGVLESNTLKKFVEFYIHTGEYDDPELHITKVLDVVFEVADEDGNVQQYPISTESLDGINKLIAENN